MPMWGLCLLLLAAPLNAYLVSVGDATVNVPLTFGYVGPIGCININCDDQGDVFSKAAMQKAVDDIDNTPSLEYFHNLTIKLFDTSKSSDISEVASLKDYSDILAVVGMSDDCVADMAILAGYNKLGVADSCSFDITTYGDFATTTILFSTSANTLSNTVIAILTRFGWNSVGLVMSSDDTTSYYTSVQSDISSILHGSFDVRVQSSLSSSSTPTQYLSQVSSDSANARIFVIVDASPQAAVLRSYLLAMTSLGLMDGGDYAIVAFVANDPNRKWLSDPNSTMYLGLNSIPNGYNVTSDRLKNAYRNLLIVSDSAPGDYASEQWNTFKDTVSGDVSNCGDSCDENLENTYWEKTARDYDLILLMATAGMGLFMNGIDITQAANYWEYMLLRPFTSITGFPDYVDGNGMLVGSAQIMYFTTISGSYGLWPVAAHHVDPTDLTSYNTTEYGPGLSISWISGAIPPDTPACGFQGELCLKPRDRILIIAICVSVTVLCILVIIAALLCKRYRYERRLHSLDFLIDRKDVILKRHVNILSERSLASIGGSIAASQTLKDSHFLVDDFANDPSEKKSVLGGSFISEAHVSGADPSDDRWEQIDDFAVGLFEGTMIGLKRINKYDIHLTRNVRKEILLMQECTHENLIGFRGMIIQSPYVFQVNELASRASIRDILENDQLPLEDVFLNQMCRDVVSGLEYLHSSDIGCHGRLKSSNCLIDSRWMVRLSSFGLRSLRMDEQHGREDVQEGRDELWTAPEMLRETNWLAVSPSLLVKKADIYSLAILLYEIFGRAGPWGDIAMEPKDILERLRNHHGKSGRIFRPDLDLLKESPEVIQQTVAVGWAEDPMDRPTIGMVRKKLRVLTVGLKKTIMDSMVGMIEKYTAKLEKDITDRNEQLAKEKMKSEELLKMMLPPVVADSLKLGNNVSAQSFDRVTVYFSDCPGFVEMSATSKPIEIVAFLNDLYTCFDNIINNYDVYKVETIADAYMVVSGLPTPNGPHHVGEIASMGLALLESIKTFKIRHRPDETVKLRIGIHSGPCVAGVVGLKMPRYCLFGDTVNTASRMESNGIPLHINCSQAAKDALDQIGGYMTEERGLVEMKGKGQQMTYFVTGEDLNKRRERIEREKVKYPTLRGTAQSGDQHVF